MTNARRYSNLTAKELLSFIHEFCGDSPEDFDVMVHEQSCSIRVVNTKTMEYKDAGASEKHFAASKEDV